MPCCQREARSQQGLTPPATLVVFRAACDAPSLACTDQSTWMDSSLTPLILLLLACAAMGCGRLPWGSDEEAYSVRLFREGRRRRAQAMSCESDVLLGGPNITTYPMFDANRKRVLDLLDLQSDELILMVGKPLEFRDGSDTEILFRQSSDVWYMANVDRPGCTLVVSPSDGHATLLVKRQSKTTDTFDGPLPSFEALAEMHDTDTARYTEDMREIISTHNGTIYTNDKAELKRQYEFINNAIDDKKLRSAIREARSLKNEFELELLRHSSQVAADAHIHAWSSTSLQAPLNSEFVVENAFTSACYACGLRFQAYIPIVGSGPNAAILHYNAAERDFSDGELMLIDAAPETHGYASDVTRTYPVNGVFTEDQKLIYDIVLDAQNSAIKVFVPGSSWPDVCAAAFKAITRGLLEAGFILGGTALELYERRIYSTFMPHGQFFSRLGHSVGLDVHDVSFVGQAKVGHVYTVEPGVYFIDKLLDEALDGPNAAHYNATKISEFRGSGGVRIEDVVAITPNGNECLSCGAPRETFEIEAIMATRS